MLQVRPRLQIHLLPGHETRERFSQQRDESINTAKSSASGAISPSVRTGARPRTCSIYFKHFVEAIASNSVTHAHSIISRPDVKCISSHTGWCIGRLVPVNLSNRVITITGSKTRVVSLARTHAPTCKALNKRSGYKPSAEYVNYMVKNVSEQSDEINDPSHARAKQACSHTQPLLPHGEIPQSFVHNRASTCC